MQLQPVRCGPAREVGGAAAILAVAEDRGAERDAMSAQLMGPPGDRQQREPTRPRPGVVDAPIIGDRGLAVRRSGADALAAASLLLRQRQIDAALHRRWQADDDSPVDL